MASYVPLEPSFSQAVAGKELSYDGNSVSLFTSTSFLYTLFFVIIVLVASSQYVRAGILRMEASESGIRKSNDLIKKTTYGLLGVFGLWLILNTVNKDLLLGDVGLGGFRSKGGGSVAQVVPPFVAGGGNFGGAGAQGISGDEKSVREQLAAVNVGINKNPCEDSSQKNCTDVGGVNSKLLNTIIALKNDCKCSLEITGGSEKAGHSNTSNHYTGNAVDLSLTDDLNLFLKTKGKNVGTDTKCDTKYSYGGYIFWDEAQGCDGVGGSRHFHVSLTGR